VRGARLVEQLEERVATRCAHPLERGNAELAAEAGRHGQEAPATVRQAPQSMADRLVHALGDRQPFQLVLLEHPLLAQEPRQLGEKQRVALGAPVDCSHEAARSDDARAQLDVARYGRLGEPGEHDATRGLLAGELGQGGCERMVGADLGVTVGAQDHDVGPVEFARDELEQQQ
jgi:hypothetical protein